MLPADDEKSIAAELNPAAGEVRSEVFGEGQHPPRPLLSRPDGESESQSFHLGAVDEGPLRLVVRDETDPLRIRQTPPFGERRSG